MDIAGLTHKIGNNQVRVIRLLLTGTHEDRERITNEGRLDEWSSDNLKYLADTFGWENIVSAALQHGRANTAYPRHPCTDSQRRAQAQEKEEQVKKRYRKKPTDAARLCADDVMTRTRLKSYQDTYAQAMSSYEQT